MGKKKAGEVFIEVDADLRKLEADLKKMEKKVQDAVNRANNKAKITPGGIGAGTSRLTGAVAGGFAVIETVRRLPAAIEFGVSALEQSLAILEGDLVRSADAADKLSAATEKLFGPDVAKFLAQPLQRGNKFVDFFGSGVASQTQLGQLVNLLSEPDTKGDEAANKRLQGVTNVINRMLEDAQRRQRGAEGTAIDRSFVQRDQEVVNALRKIADLEEVLRIAFKGKKGGINTIGALTTLEDVLIATANAENRNRLEQLTRPKRPRREQSPIDTISTAIGGFRIGQQKQIQEDQLEEAKKTNDLLGNGIKINALAPG